MQMVGRNLAIARELLNTQTEVPLLVTSDMQQALPAPFNALLVPLQQGAIRLRSSPVEQQLFTLRQYSHLKLIQPDYMQQCGSMAGQPIPRNAVEARSLPAVAG
jgi:hypothetical protein